MICATYSMTRTFFIKISNDMNLSNNYSPTIENNPAFQNILTRTSVRQYAPTPVSDELKSALLHAAMSAPTAVNRQPWEFILIDDHKILAALADALPYAKMAAHAPMAIAVCANPERFLEGIDDTLWIQDLSAASENILLAAHALGLGGVWTCLYPHEDRMAAAKTILGITADIVPFNLIPVGYPEREHSPFDKWNPERVHHNHL